MSNYTLPHFGQLNPGSLEGYYDVEIEFGGQQVQLDLNFEGKTIDPQRLDVVKKFIGDLPGYHSKNIAAIESDFEDGDTVKEYIEHHLEEIDKEELSTIIDFDNKAISPEKQMLSKIQLVRLGLYPDSEDQFAIFDYSIGQELTQYLVVVNTNEKGDLEYMTMES